MSSHLTSPVIKGRVCFPVPGAWVGPVTLLWLIQCNRRDGVPASKQNSICAHPLFFWLAVVTTKTDVIKPAGKRVTWRPPDIPQSLPLGSSIKQPSRPPELHTLQAFLLESDSVACRGRSTVRNAVSGAQLPLQEALDRHCRRKRPFFLMEAAWLVTSVRVRMCPEHSPNSTCSPGLAGDHFMYALPSRDTWAPACPAQRRLHSVFRSPSPC